MYSFFQLLNVYDFNVFSATRGMPLGLQYSNLHSGVIRCYLLLCYEYAVGWVAGTASGMSKTEWWGAGVVICLERGADLHMAQLMPLPLTVSCFSKIRTGFTLVVSLTRVVPDKEPLNGCLYVIWWLKFYTLLS